MRWPASNLLALADEFNDAARQQAGNLHNSDSIPAFHLDREGLALVVGARFVELGVDELAWHIGNAGYVTVDGAAIYMNVEDIHENGNALARR